VNDNGERTAQPATPEQQDFDGDRDVREQLDAFHQYLASLELREGLDQVQPPERLLRYSEIENLVRWRITLKPVRSLRAAARFRVALAQSPLCITAQACNISAEELHFSLTTVHLSLEEVRARVEAALRATGCQGVVDVEPRPSRDL
jgi:hypothetical protein